MKLIKIVCRLVITVFLLSLVSNAQAYNADDYYRAGLKLYRVQDYDKAIQYFTAAIQSDPQSAKAFQGRGNCYYAKADYADALQDYKQVQQLRPSPEINQFVSSVQAKVDAQSSGTNMAGSSSSADYLQFFNKGKSDFQNKQYTSAAIAFEKAMEKDHTPYDLFYYLGLTYKYMGDNKDAALAFGVANQKKPSREVASYVKNLREKLSQDDRDWVDQELSAAASGKEVHLKTRPPNETDYALRLEGGMTFPNLTDFAADANNGVTYTLSQGSASYNAAIPNLGVELGFEPVVNLAQDIELGFLVAAIPVGTVSEQFTQGSNTTTNSFGITGYVLGLNLRWLLGNGPVKLFIAAGPLVAPIGISYSHVVNDVPETGSFSSWAIGGQGQLGIDFHLSDNISFGPYVSFQAITASNFSGDVIDNSTNVDTTGTLYTLPNGQWPSVLPIPASQSVPSGAKPTTVDLSGVIPGIHLSLFF